MALSEIVFVQNLKVASCLLSLEDIVANACSQSLVKPNVLTPIPPLADMIKRKILRALALAVRLNNQVDLWTV